MSPRPTPLAEMPPKMYLRRVSLIQYLVVQKFLHVIRRFVSCPKGTCTEPASRLRNIASGLLGIPSVVRNVVHLDLLYINLAYSHP
jgi:hypothetical protein